MNSTINNSSRPYYEFKFFSKSDLDLINVYFKDFSNYPLLSKEEERKLIKDIQSGKEVSILKSSEKLYSVKKLDFDKLFSLLQNCNNAKFIVDILINYYEKSNRTVDFDDYNNLLKYRNTMLCTGKPLNDSELNHLFGKSFKHDGDIKVNEKELVSEIKSFIKYKDAVDKMVSSNLRLVTNVAKKYKGCEFLDLIEEGNIGLLKAIDKFDDSKNTRFSTYALHWIFQSINDYFIENKSSIRLPYNKSLKLISFLKNVEKLESEFQRSLSNIEISEQLNIPIDTVNEYLSYYTSTKVLSLDLPCDDSESFSILDNIADDVDIENDILNEFSKKDINILFNALNNNEITTIMMRYGFNSENRIYTYEQIANIIHVSRQRVHAIEKTAIKKMRKLANENAFCSSLKEYIR